MARKAAAPIPLSELLLQAQSSPKPVEANFEIVPDVMRRRGRVEGFEALRDLLLEHWQGLAREYNIPLQALLKLVLETDRHALFAALSEEKLGDADQAKQRRWTWYQQYLTGAVDDPAPPDEKLSELPGENTQIEENNGGRDEDVQG